MAWAAPLSARVIEYWRSAPPVPDRNVGAHTVFTGRQRWMLMVAFTLLVIFRIPGAWVHGRFQAEEASVFLAYAWHFPWQDALFRPFAGYWNLGATAPTTLAVLLIRGGIMPLDRAPYLTMGVGLLFQCLPALLLLTGRSPWLSWRLAVIAGLLVIAIAPSTEEVSFNVLHIQFHLAVCAALILSFEIPTRRCIRDSYLALLFLGPLCGPGAIVLSPLFAVRAMLDRDKRRAWQFVAISLGAFVQLAIFAGGETTRTFVSDPLLILASMFVRLIAAPFTGIDVSVQLSFRLIKDHIDTWPLAVLAVAWFGGLLGLAFQRRSSARWLVCCAVVVAMLTFSVRFSNIDENLQLLPNFGERYNYIPLALLGLSFVILAVELTGALRILFGALVALFLFNGAIQYPRPMPTLAGGPDWPTEVRNWRADGRYSPAAWPRHFHADLSPPPKDCALPDPPQYCEAGWLEVSAK